MLYTEYMCSTVYRVHVQYIIQWTCASMIQSHFLVVHGAHVQDSVQSACEVHCTEYV